MKVTFTSIGTLFICLRLAVGGKICQSNQLRAVESLLQSSWRNFLLSTEFECKLLSSQDTLYWILASCSSIQSALILYFFGIYFNIIFPQKPRSPSFLSSFQGFRLMCWIHFSSPPCILCVSSISSSLTSSPSYIRKLRIMKSFNVCFSLLCFYSLSSGSKESSQHFIFKHSQYLFSFHSDTPSYTLFKK